MRPRPLLVTAAVGAIVAGGVFAGQGTASAGSMHTLRVKEKITKLAPEDAGKDGVKMGDRVTVASELKDLTGKKVGIDTADCGAFSGDTMKNAKFNCTGTYDLGGDTLFVGGIFTYAEKNGKFAILGGTGRYRGAAGEMDFVTLAPDTFDDTFHFTS
jgi:hypothetical protein